MKWGAQKPARIASRLLRWWVAELSACSHEILTFIAPKWQPSLTVYADDTRLLILESGSAQGAPIVEMARAGFAAELPAKLPIDLPHAIERGQRVRLAISSERAFTQRLRLPMAALPHLKTAVGLQLPKLLPMDPARLLTDFEIAGADPSTSILNIDLVAVKRAEVEVLSRGLLAWGLRITSMHLTDGPHGRFRFRFSSTSASGRVTLDRTDRALISAAAALGLICAAVTGTESYRARHALDEARATTHVAAAEALGRRQHLLARLEPLNALSKVEVVPSAPAILAEVTALVPHDSWLTTFELKDRELRIVGISPDSSVLVRHLASSAVLSDIELRSSMSAGIGTGRDRFEIAAKIKAGLP